jgi:ribosomal protein S21
MYSKQKYRDKTQQKDKQFKLKPLEVRVIGDFDDAIRKFKTYFQRERIIGQLKERSAYEKPSDKKRRKKREAYQRSLMLDAREKMIASGEWEKYQKNKINKRQKKLYSKINKRKEFEESENGTPKTW